MGDRRAPQSIALVQDFVNTYDVEEHRDALVEPGGLSAFAATHELGPLGLTSADVPALQDLREALRDALLAHAGRRPAAEPRRRLDEVFSRAPLVLSVADDGTTRLAPAPGITGASAFAAAVAAGIATATGDGSWQRLKACAADDCRWVFYDRSPAGRGRWCTMQVCGSRAKMRAYRDRRRER